MEEIVRRLRKSRKRWTVMARPKKKPEVRKTNWTNWFLTVISIFAAFVAIAMGVEHTQLEKNFAIQKEAFAERMRSLDNLIIHREEVINKLENKLAQTTAELLDERDLNEGVIKNLTKKNLENREEIELLKTEILLLKEAKAKEEKMPVKKIPRVHRPRYNDGVVRPRVYKW